MLQPKLTKVIPLEQLKLKLFYENGEEKIFDVAPYTTGDWYGMLKQTAYFHTVRLLPGGVGIEWQEGQDISPHELYDDSISVNA